MGSTLRLGAIVSVALVLLPAAGSGGSTRSGLYGTVRKGPTKPVCQVDVPCDGAVYGTLIFSRPGHEVVRVRSTEQGRYRIALPPGYYDVRSTVKIGLTKLPKPHAVHVRAGRWDRINLFFDTGIR